MRYRVVGVRDGAAAQAMMVDAADEAAAHLAASASGLLVIEVRPAAGGLRLWRLAGDAAQDAGGAGGNPGRFDVDLFCEEMLALLGAGIPVGEALETLAERGASLKRRAPADVLAVVLRRVREGQPLSAALALRPDVFPQLLTESLRAAERTSDYGAALGRFVRYRRLTREVRERLIAASTYPLILLAVSTLVLLFMLGYVVPRFADVYKDMGDRLPAASRLLLIVGQALGGHPWLALAALAAVLAAILAVLRSRAARAGLLRAVVRLPRLRAILEAAEFARLYRALALLVHGGIPLVTALDMVRGLLPPHLAGRLDGCRRALSEGRPFAASMSEQGLTTVVADRFLRVGERTGALADMMDRAAGFHEDEVARGADWAGRVIGPVMMLAMGLLIGLVVVLMYMPIFELADAVQ
jgi:general secretion pathway protein F